MPSHAKFFQIGKNIRGRVGDVAFVGSYKMHLGFGQTNVC